MAARMTAAGMIEQSLRGATLPPLARALNQHRLVATVISMIELPKIMAHAPACRAGIAHGHKYYRGNSPVFVGDLPEFRTRPRNSVSQNDHKRLPCNRLCRFPARCPATRPTPGFPTGPGLAAFGKNWQLVMRKQVTQFPCGVRRGRPRFGPQRRFRKPRTS